ncbi:MAG: hypothetical protein ABSH28_04200 [Acidobacteriota bacterium]|jgi:hypothetical protein
MAIAYFAAPLALLAVLQQWELSQIVQDFHNWLIEWLRDWVIGLGHEWTNYFLSQWNPYPQFSNQDFAAFLQGEEIRHIALWLAPAIYLLSQFHFLSRRRFSFL